MDIERQEILLVTERHDAHRQANENMWKIPGGALDTPNEEIGDCSIREIWEETGVKTEFVALLAFRHLHNFRFGKYVLPLHYQLTHI